jgi:hypothetical protein
MPQLCAAAYGCLEGMWLPTLGHCCLSSIVHIASSHYLDMITINAHLHSHSEHKVHSELVGYHLLDCLLDAM